MAMMRQTEHHFKVVFTTTIILINLKTFILDASTS
jgi:hypothetical protein